MNMSRSRQHGFAHILIIIIVVVILAALGWVAWKQLHKNSSNQTSDINANNLSKARIYPLKVPLDTKKQGDCTLTMTDPSGKEVLKDENSTRGKKGETGCEEWKIDTTKLASGKYDIKVVFKADGQKDTVIEAHYAKP